ATRLAFGSPSLATPPACGRGDRRCPTPLPQAGGAGGGPAQRQRSGSLAAFFLFHAVSHVAIGREAHGVPLDLRHEAEREVMMVPFVAPAFEAGAGVLLGQLDAVAVDMVDRADMHAVGADHLHVLAD